MGVLLAMAVFVLSHVVIVRTGVKPALIARFGERAYLAFYSVLSLGLLAWVIWSVLAAERIVIWATPDWAYGFAIVLSAVAFALIGLGALAPNPLSASFRKTGFDPDRPGMIGWLRHPLVWGLTLWGLAHVPANGDWPSLVLFAGSVAFGVIGVFALERRHKRRLGDDAWRRLTAGRGHLDRRSLLGVAFGLALWLALLALHPFLFGADPLAALMARLG